MDLINWISPAVQSLLLLNLQTPQVQPYYNMAICSSLQKDMGYASWQVCTDDSLSILLVWTADILTPFQSEISAILCLQSEAGQVAGTMIKEMIERVKQNSVARRQIFKNVEWILPWINTLNSVSAGVLEVSALLFSLLRPTQLISLYSSKSLV